MFSKRGILILIVLFISIFLIKENYLQPKDVTSSAITQNSQCLIINQYNVEEAIPEIASRFWNLYWSVYKNEDPNIVPDLV